MILCFLFPNQENSQRNLVSFEDNSLDFEVDLTDLETFGETTPIKASKMLKKQNEQDACVKPKKVTSALSLSTNKRSSERLANTSSSSLEEMDTSLTVMDDTMTKQTAQLVLGESSVPKTERVRQDTVQESDKDLAFTGDSDDEKLVIDDSVSTSATAATPPKPKTTPSCSVPPVTPVSETVPVTSESSSPQKVTRRTQQSKKVKTGDQLGEILRMQTAMFTSASDTNKCPTTTQETGSPNQCMGPSVYSHPTSLVKPCVSSYLERNQNQNGEICTAPHKSAPVVNVSTTVHKS